jgi:hypothetical protein
VWNNETQSSTITGRRHTQVLQCWENGGVIFLNAFFYFTIASTSRLTLSFPSVPTGKPFRRKKWGRKKLNFDERASMLDFAD